MNPNSKHQQYDYHLSQFATHLHDEARKKVAAFIHAPDEKECIFTRGTTEGINLVAGCWGRTFLKAGVVAPQTKGTGSVWDIALSRDPQQQFLYVADGHDQKVFILRRDTLEVAGSFGDGGRVPGTFYSVGSVAVDSKGNVYTGENLEGKRVQKFVPNAGR